MKTRTVFWICGSLAAWLRPILFRYQGMCVENLFHFPGIYIFSACNNHISFSVNDIEKALFIQAAKITGVKPSISYGRLCGRSVFIVSLHHIAAPEDHFAHIADRHMRTAFIYDTQFQIEMFFANACLFSGEIFGEERRNAAR